MSVHLGMHLRQMMNMFKKYIHLKTNVLKIIKLMIVIICLYGIYCFIQNNMMSYMFLINEFVFFDFIRVFINDGTMGKYRLFYNTNDFKSEGLVCTYFNE